MVVRDVKILNRLRSAGLVGFPASPPLTKNGRPKVKWGGGFWTVAKVRGGLTVRKFMEFEGQHYILKKIGKDYEIHTEST